MTTSAENLGNGALAKWRFLVPDSRSAGRVFGAKRRKPARHRETASSHARAKVSIPLLGRNEVTRTNRGCRRHWRSRNFCRFFPAGCPKKSFSKNSDSPDLSFLSVVAFWCCIRDGLCLGSNHHGWLISHFAGLSGKLKNISPELNQLTLWVLIFSFLYATGCCVASTCYFSRNWKNAPSSSMWFWGRANMNVLLILLTSLFSIAILLVAGFQFIRLVVNELTEMVVEAWRSPEMPPSHWVRVVCY